MLAAGIRQTRHARGLIVPLLTLALFVSACASDEPAPNDTTDTGTDSEDAGATGVEEAQAAFEAAQEPLEFVAPSEPYDVSGASGADIWLVSCCEAVPILKQWRVTMEEALEPHGVSVTVFDGQGQVAEFNRGMTQAVAASPDAIVLLTIPPELVTAQVADAKAAGIPVIATMAGTAIEPTVDGVVAEVSFDFEQGGRLMADWMIADSGGQGNVVIINSSDARASEAQMRGLEDELEQRCPDCTVKVEDSPVTTWGTRLATLTTSAIRRDPDLEYIMPIYDAMAFNILPAVQQVGAEGTIQVGALNATPAIMEMLQSGATPMKMDVGPPNDWFSFALADAVLRVLTGNDPVTDYQIGLRAFTTDNVADLDVSKENSEQWYGIDVAAEFQEIWLSD